MRRLVQIAGLIVALTAVALWLSLGANHGWTKTSVPLKKVDEVTGIEGVEYQKRFVPGVDFLGAMLLVAGLLEGVSLCLRRPMTYKTPNYDDKI